MFKKSSATALLFALSLAACAAPQPRVIQAHGTDMPDIRLTVGMAAQVEMPDQGRVQSMVVGNPTLVDAQQTGETVNLIAKGGAGETNLIIRSRDNDGAVKVYQYKLIVDEK